MVRKITTIVCILFALFVPIVAQVTTSAISGVVLDEKNQGLPGANIMAIHVPSGTQYVTTSRVGGLFDLSNIRTGGPYKISISFVGYETTVINDVYLSLNRNWN